MLAVSFVLWAIRSEYSRISKLKTHIARALAARGCSTDLGRGNETAKISGTFCVGDDCEVHVVKFYTNVGCCKM